MCFLHDVRSASEVVYAGLPDHQRIVRRCGSLVPSYEFSLLSINIEAIAIVPDALLSALILILFHEKAKLTNREARAVKRRECSTPRLKRD